MPPWCGIKAAFYVLVQKRGEKEKDGAEEEEGICVAETTTGIRGSVRGHRGPKKFMDSDPWLLTMDSVPHVRERKLLRLSNGLQMLMSKLYA